MKTGNVLVDAIQELRDELKSMNEKLKEIETNTKAVR